MNTGSAQEIAEKDAVLRLKCPECSGGLNLRRKHLGIKGKCVHCEAPIMAVEENGQVLLKGEKGIEAMPAGIEAAPAPVEEPRFDSRTVSPELPDPRPASLPEAPLEDVGLSSAWGFPQREDSPKMSTPETPSFLAPEPTPLSEPPALPSFAAPPEVAAPSEVASESESSAFDQFMSRVSQSAPPELPVETPVETVPRGPEETGNTSGFFNEAKLDRDLKEEAPVADSEPKTPGAFSGHELFESKDEPSSFSNLFSSESGEVNSGWGAKVPAQNHASISPFSTGSADPEPGFAETLFREKAKEDTGRIEAKSPFVEVGSDEETPLTGGLLFSQPSKAAAKAEPEEEVVLDGDGRPMRPMTPEEKAKFAEELMHFGEYHKRSPWVKRIVRLFVTLIFLGAGGYAAYVFLPQEQVEVAKAKVIEWLEPGSVLMQYLPFEIGESESGEKGVKIKALEGLDNLSTQMDSYLSTAEEQLNSTLPEGAEGYKREAPVDMPEIPKLPFSVGGQE